MSAKRITRRDFVTAGAAVPAALASVGCTNPARRLPLGRVSREVTRVVAAYPTRDGAGVKLKRALGGPELGMLDPFLLLDEIRSDRPEDYVRGFPRHPHRGFETVTYMLSGAMEHRDSVGNHGRLGPGSIQWMTAGRGIVHSEMPRQEKGLLWGFQLWVNLPAAKKMMAPRYQDIAPARVPEIAVDDAQVRVLAGQVGPQKGPVQGIVTAPTALDVRLGPKATFRQPVPSGHTVFVYALEGEARLGRAAAVVREGHVAILERGDHVLARAPRSARFLLFAGKPLREPVARYGPFVMNTQAEIRQAIEDYRTGRLVRRGG